MTTDYINEYQLRRAIQVMKPDGQLFEVRLLKKNPKRTWSGYFTSANALVDALKTVDLRGLSAYITLNQISDACYAREQHDKFVQSPEVTTNDKDVEGYNWLFIDLDPVRPTGISSSDSELAEAKALAKKIYSFLKMQGFTDPLIGMSGNGVHLLYSIGLQKTEEHEQLIKRCLQALDMLFSTDKVKVDTANFNPARICKLYGTLAQKGTGTEERPHRMAYIMSKDDDLKQTFKVYLQKLADMMPEQPATPARYNGYSPQTFDVEAWLREHGLEVTDKRSGNGYTKYILKECPFDSSHKAPDSCITVGTSGAIGFHCFHDHCQGKTWRDVRIKYEPNAYDRSEDDARIDAGWQEHMRHNRDLDISYEEPEAETKEEPYFLTALDILNQPDEDDEFIRSGIEGIDNRLGGLKKGYVSLLTGLRGGSKSTLLTTIALTAVQDGHNVLCYSGELSGKDFMKWMNLQAAGKNHVHQSKFRTNDYYVTKDVKAQIAHWLDGRFILWNNKHGNKFEKLYSQIERKIEEQKTDLVILDNLMAMDIHVLDSYDKYNAQSNFVEQLMQLAMRSNTHIIFVAHPRKALGFLRLDDVAGTGNLTNRIDNAFIVHRVNNDFKRLSHDMFKWKEDHDAYRGTNVIEIAKDRHNGNMDVFIPLWFEKETKRLKNSPAEMITYGWDKSDGFEAVLDDEDLPFC